jgi:hypothetical protein
VGRFNFDIGEATSYRHDTPDRTRGAVGMQMAGQNFIHAVCIM